MLEVMGNASLQIGHGAQRTGVSVDAIRFYEKKAEVTGQLNPDCCERKGFL
jgi:hypothetical protein